MPVFPTRDPSSGFELAERYRYPTALEATEHVYRTVDGDDVDLIGYLHYGTTQGVSEAIYTRNPWLARLGPILPAGLSIILPTLTTATRVNLWSY